LPQKISVPLARFKQAEQMDGGEEIAAPA